MAGGVAHDFNNLLGVILAHADLAQLPRVLGADVEFAVVRSEAAGGTVVRADPVQIEQVLLNLSTNARQAMPAGGRLRLETRAVAFDEAFVRLSPWARVGCFVELSVSDTGVGMDALGARLSGHRDRRRRAGGARVREVTRLDQLLDRQ